MSPCDHRKRGTVSTWPCSAVTSDSPGWTACLRAHGLSLARGGHAPLRRNRGSGDGSGPGLSSRGPVRMHFSKCRCELELSATPRAPCKHRGTWLWRSQAVIQGPEGRPWGGANTARVARRWDGAGDEGGEVPMGTGPGSQPSLDRWTRHLRTAAARPGPHLSALQGSCHCPPTRRGTEASGEESGQPAPKGRNLWSRDLNPGPLAVSPLLVSVGDCPLLGRSLASQVPHGRLWVPGVPGSPKLGRVGGD